MGVSRVRGTELAIPLHASNEPSGRRSGAGNIAAATPIPNPTTTEPAGARLRFQRFTRWLGGPLCNPWLVALAALVTVCVRANDALFHPHFWAEDGTIFWLQNYSFGLDAFRLPYGGYLNTAPRLLAWAFGFFPYLYHPTLYSLGGALLTAWTALTIATATRDRRLGALLAMALVLVRHDGGNVFLNLANTQWFMACALPWILASTAPPSNGWRINQLLFVALAVTTGPFGVFLLPLWFVKLIPSHWTHPKLTRFDRLLGATGLAGSLLQLSVVLSIRLSKNWVLSASQVPIIALRIFSDTFGVDRSPVFALVMAISLAATLRLPRYRLLRIASFYLTAVVAAGTALKFGHMSDQIFVPATSGPRYFFTPAVMLAGVSLSVFFDEYRRGFRYLAAALCALLLLGTVHGGFVRPDRDRVFASWANAVDRIGRERVVVKLNPDYFKPLVIPPRRRAAAPGD